ncbi:RING/U-box superfamily protein [Euphorbia peplus]|nr:RING/U-box superfamily protein [Euphorbia peplus]
MASDANSFGKSICSICYEDLKPIVEDLQAISICGHVFHELCLQQWFEYCKGSRKCPVCKQNCNGSSVARLYFQSLGEQNEVCVSKKRIEGDEDPEVLRGEVARLEMKVSGFSSISELQAKEINQLSEELHICRDELKKEVILRNDAIGQMSRLQKLLHSKSEELDSVKLECLGLKERNMALAKELAALKLVSDLNLEEDDILKLASFGNEDSYKNTIDILRKSLVVRNKSYKELMAKCNELGRGEARSCKKLEKARGKIIKLKSRVQELEMIVEVKENEALRALTSSKKIYGEEFAGNGTYVNSNSLPNSHLLSEGQKGKHAKSTTTLDQTKTLKGDQRNFNIINLSADSTKEQTTCVASDKEGSTFFEMGDFASDHPVVHDLSSDTDSKDRTREAVKSTAKSEMLNDITSRNIEKGRIFDIRTCMSNSEKGNILAASTTEEDPVVNGDVEHIQPMVNIRKETPSSVPLSKPGDICFSSGLMGPDGTNRYLGKWCKRSQSKGEGAGASSGNLIAVGSDGRGGRVKVLRSLNQVLDDGKENSTAAKRFKHGSKSSSRQSPGSLQIEHFFGRATN